MDFISYVEIKIHDKIGQKWGNGIILFEILTLYMKWYNIDSS